TGDLGRIDREGNLHFLGRSGSRVKIRGHTVELTEVEGALCSCPGITKAAVIALDGDTRPESDRLVAYLTTADDMERNVVTVRSHLVRKLPIYMVPSGIVFVDSLPLTASGKVDRKA